MRRRALLTAALIVMGLGAASAAPNPFEAPALAVRAGFSGVARPGRWMPIRVTVVGGAATVDATVTATWGDATAVQPVTIAPRARLEIRFLLRAIDATTSVRVTLDGGGERLAATDVPLDLRDVDTTIVACIGPASPDCTVSVPSGDAPSSWRDLDLADDVRWLDVTPPGIAQRVALDRWRAMRWWNDSGLPDPVLGSFSARARQPLIDPAVVIVAALSLVVASAALTRQRAHPLVALAIPVVVAGGSIGAVTWRAPGVDLEVIGIARQFAGLPGAIVSARGEVTHADSARVMLRPDLDEATVGVTGRATATAAYVDAGGRAAYAVAASPTARHRFALDGVRTNGWLAAQATGGRVQILNTSTTPLPCALDGPTPRDLGVVPAGLSVDLGDAARLADARVTCQLPDGGVQWDGTPTSTRAHMWLVFHFWPGDGLTGHGDAAR